MIFYFFVLVCCCALSYLNQVTNQNGALIASRKTFWDKSGYYVVACVVLVLFLALRADTVGADLANYKIAYKDYVVWYEPAYLALQFFVGAITRNFQVFMMVCATLTLIPMLIVVKLETKKYLTLAMLIFLSCMLVNSLYILRAALGYSCLFVAFYLKDKPSHRKLYYGMLLLSVLFQYTLVILAMVILIFELDLTFYWYSWLGLCGVAAAFGGKILRVVLLRLRPHYAGYLTEVSNFAWTNILLYGLITVLCVIYFKPLIASSHKNLLLINMAVLMLIFNLTCTWFPVYGRIVDGFKLFCVFLIPRIIGCEDNSKIRVLYRVGFTAFFLVYFYQSISSGVGIFPYKFFWWK